MALLSNETIALLQLTFLGGISCGAIYYRLYMWNHRRIVVVRAMTASAVVFGSFGLGVTLSLFFESGPKMQLVVSGYAMPLGPPFLFLAYRFWKGGSITPVLFKFAIIIIAWGIVTNYCGAGHAGTMLQIFVIGLSFTCLCLIAGILNGLLGPLIPTFIVVHALSNILNSNSAGWSTIPFSESFELILGILPDWLSSFRVLAGLILTVLGVAEFLNFFGVKISMSLDRLHDLA